MKSCFNPTLPYGVAAFDAGAANLIFSLVKRLPIMPTWLDLDGPAKDLWSQYFPYRVPSNESLTRDLTSVITGTGWGSPLEHKVRVRARELNVPSIGVLDHWVNYETRFSHQGEFCLPDEIWVFDLQAEEIARATFPRIPIFLMKNDYIEQLTSKITPVKDIVSNDVLYLLEPLRSCWGKEIPGEFQALDFFLHHIEKLGSLKTDCLRLRLHPSEPPNKYNDYLKRESRLGLRLSKNSLAEELSEVRYVAGCQTFAMVVALNAGRTVYSSLPPWAPPCALPHPGIIHLRDI